MLNEFIIIELVKSSWPSGLSHNYRFSTRTSLPWFSVFSRYHVFCKEKLIKLISGLFSNFFEIWELLPFSKTASSVSLFHFSPTSICLHYPHPAKWSVVNTSITSQWMMHFFLGKKPIYCILISSFPGLKFCFQTNLIYIMSCVIIKKDLLRFCQTCDRKNEVS